LLHDNIINPIVDTGHFMPMTVLKQTYARHHKAKKKC